jgi:hypothetical protein
LQASWIVCESIISMVGAVTPREREPSGNAEHTKQGHNDDSGSLCCAQC